MNCFRMESYEIKFKAALLDTEKTLALATQSSLVSSTVCLTLLPDSRWNGVAPNQIMSRPLPRAARAVKTLHLMDCEIMMLLLCAHRRGDSRQSTQQTQQ